MPGVSIRRMRHADVPEVMEIDRRCFPIPWSENAFRSELGNVNACYLVAELARGSSGMAGRQEGERIVGYAGAWIVMDEAHITILGVDPPDRRHGVGERLLSSLLSEAAGQGVRRASLEVRESNGAAQALYSKFGFLPIARRRRYYTDTEEDAIVMWIEELSEVFDNGQAAPGSSRPLTAVSASLLTHPASER
jgi:ribosomal-protein-alanine N-acetyltransferase